MDPYRFGNEILKDIALQFNNEKINDFPQIDKFFEILMEKTQGKVNVNFLDMGTWDSIEAFYLNKSSRILTLVWHDFRNKDEGEIDKRIRQMVFPASLYSLSIKVRSIVPISFSNGAIFLVNGFSKTKKDIKKIYKQEHGKFEIIDRSFFEKIIVGQNFGSFKYIQFHNTPLYSLAIVPKDIVLSDLELRRLMFGYNIHLAMKKIADIVSFFHTSAAIEEDTIIEKMAITRRTLEYVLKIEISFRDIKLNEDYSNVRLGKLVSALKSYHSSQHNLLTLMLKNLNEFLHDTGKPIEKNKANVTAALVWTYIILLAEEMDQNPLPSF